MKKTLILAALLAAVSTAGCYTSRRVAGDELRGGLLNPYLWVTIPVDTLLSPYQVIKWANDDTDDWTPWDVDEERERYIIDRPYYNERMNSTK